ncbi:hypothetical protein B0X78_03390 [bacterium AM6]|nr:hypothetical protein B0X78_03390 [bacterium AM6]
MESKDFYHPLFTVNNGATLLDVWFGDSSGIASAYLAAGLKRQADCSEPMQPLGSLHEWRIGAH